MNSHATTQARKAIHRHSAAATAQPQAAVEGWRTINGRGRKSRVQLEIPGREHACRIDEYDAVSYTPGSTAGCVKPLRSGGLVTAAPAPEARGPGGKPQSGSAGPVSILGRKMPQLDCTTTGAAWRLQETDGYRAELAKGI
ncbi:hypothetical protein ACCO45_009808 [Purpureocillium lilacinum]|uniref:Uncharacterized protein n=1 Tax=Purpureocillium lilacinum TaxID=33203 RepID=A0ACC4DKR1_PURLI